MMQLISYITHLTGRVLTDYECTNISNIAKQENSKPYHHDTLCNMLSSLQAGRKIDAIKAHREMSGFGLKESKDFIDSLNYNTATRLKKQMLEQIDSPNCIFQSDEYKAAIRRYIESFE